MKCKAFASQLEAHVGHSPVRGGKAIKTYRKTANNLNQLLSRVKSIFGRYSGRTEEHKSADGLVRILEAETVTLDCFHNLGDSLDRKSVV